MTGQIGKCFIGAGCRLREVSSLSLLMLPEVVDEGCTSGVFAAYCFAVKVITVKPAARKYRSQHTAIGRVSLQSCNILWSIMAKLSRNHPRTFSNRINPQPSAFFIFN
jgi:hypothetical protein